MAGTVCLFLCLCGILWYVILYTKKSGPEQNGTLVCHPKEGIVLCEVERPVDV